MLENKVAIVTGAGQGLGLGIAIALAREGAAIAVCGRTKTKLDAVVAEIEEIGGQAIAISGDLKDGDVAKMTVHSVLQRFGGIDIVVNNAQEITIGTLLDIADEEFLNGFMSGPMASLRLMKACYPHLKARGGGSIINFASGACVNWNMSPYGLYAAVKQAIRAITRTAAEEWGPDNIRTNSIAPFAQSPFMANWEREAPEEAAKFYEQIPLRRVGDPEKDIGRLVVFLCSSDASYLNGITVPADGGMANFD